MAHDFRPTLFNNSFPLPKPCRCPIVPTVVKTFKTCSNQPTNPQKVTTTPGANSVDETGPNARVRRIAKLYVQITLVIMATFTLMAPGLGLYCGSGCAACWKDGDTHGVDTQIRLQEFTSAVPHVPQATIRSTVQGILVASKCLFLSTS